MELKPGYKQTEVGVIPEDWEVRSIIDLAQITTGPFGTLLKANEYTNNEGVPLISVGEIGEGSFRITQRTPLVPWAVVRRLPQYILRKGDIVFGRKGAVDRSALVGKEQAGWFLGSDGISIRPQDDQYPPYLAYQFQRVEVQTWLLRNATGTTMPSLNQNILGRVLIPYAPLPEQRAIAEALRDVDALLDGLERLITKKRDLKLAVMQQLLGGQTRLPGFTASWEIRRLDEVAFISSGGTPSTVVPRYWDGSISWCTPTDITALNGSKYLNSTCRSITEEGLEASAAVLVPSCSVVMTSRATIGLCAINTTPVATNQGFKNFVPRENTDVEFLYYLLGFIRNEFIRYAAGSTFLEIGKEQVESHQVLIPSLRDEQSAIAVVLADMDAELATLEARRNKTRDLKQGMMQELLTGKTRLI